MKKKNKVDEDVLYENHETRHSTEPNKPIVQLNLQGEVTILPKTHLVRNVFSDLNRTVNYYSNNLNTSVIASPIKTLNSDRKIKANKLNHTFAVDRLNDDHGFAFLNSSKSNKISSKFKTVFDPNNSVMQNEPNIKRNLNESFNMTLTSVKSSGNLFKKNVLNV